MAFVPVGMSDVSSYIIHSTLKPCQHVASEVNAMEEPLLQHRDDRGVVTLTLNRPQAFNALSEAMLPALGEAVDALAKDEVVRAVVLGASGTALCAGHDLKETRAEPSLEYYQRLFAHGRVRPRARSSAYRTSKSFAGAAIEIAARHAESVSERVGRPGPRGHRGHGLAGPRPLGRV